MKISYIYVCVYVYIQAHTTCVHLYELVESNISTGVVRCLGGGQEGVRVRFRMPRWFDRWMMYWGSRQV